VARICSVQECDTPHFARGYCGKHYRQWRKANQARHCSVGGCGGPLEARGYCIKHYTRWLRYGDVNIARKRDARPTSNGASTATRRPPTAPDGPGPRLAAKASGGPNGAGLSGLRPLYSSWPCWGAYFSAAVRFAPLKRCVTDLAINSATHGWNLRGR
jgi:hypothetical protein